MWFYGTFRYLGVNKTVVDSFYDADPSPFRYTADTSRPGIDDGHIRSFAGRVAAQFSQKDKITYYHDEQDKVRGHWGISSTVPPEASAIQATPTSFVSVTKWTRTQSNKLLLDAGLAVYDQEYQENYQPDVFAGANPLVTINDNSTGKIAGAWNNPADHFSKLFTEQFAASYVTGSHSLRFGATISQAKWRLTQQFTGDAQPINYNAGAPVSITLRIPTDRRNSIKNDSSVFAQDKWTFKRATVNAGFRWDWFISATDPETLPASTWNSAVTLQPVFRREEQPQRRLYRTGRQLEGHQPARRHRLRSVRHRPDGAQGELGALRQRRGAGGGQHHRQQQPRDYRWRRLTRVPGRTSTRTARRTTRTDVSS